MSNCSVLFNFDKNTIEILSFWLEDFYFMSGEINLLTCFVVFKYFVDLNCKFFSSYMKYTNLV